MFFLITIIVPQTVCNPLSVAEFVGREFILEQMPSNDSYKTRKLVDKIHQVNENVKGLDNSLNRIQALHGPYNGASTELLNFTKNLFGNDPAFRSSILDLERGVINLKNAFQGVEDIVDLAGDITFADLSTGLLRAYLRNVEILLPPAIKGAIQDNLERFPWFSQMSESLGSLYHNFVLNDGATNLVDQMITGVLEDTGLSNVLSQHDWIRMLPEYAANFHDNVRLFQRLGSRVLPKCTFSKIYNIMDEPLAHIYNLANDAFGFLDVFDNRKRYLNLLFNQYQNLIRKINNLYPICHEYSAPSGPQDIRISGDIVSVDILGNPTKSVEATGSIPPII